MSSEDAAKATELHEALKSALEFDPNGRRPDRGAAGSRVDSTLPMLAHVAKDVAAFVQAHSGWVVTASKFATDIVLAGGGLIVLGTGFKLLAPAIQVAGFGLTLFGGLIGGAFMLAC